MVVEVDRERGRLRVRGEACSDLACHAQTVVVTEQGGLADVGALYPGDIVRLETAGEDDSSAVTRVVVLRRVWEGNASPEL
jgi:hypothetical protein